MSTTQRRSGIKKGVKLSDIYGDMNQQNPAISCFIQIEDKRIDKKKKKELTVITHQQIPSTAGVGTPCSARGRFAL